MADEEPDLRASTDSFGLENAAGGVLIASEPGYMLNGDMNESFNLEQLTDVDLGMHKPVVKKTIKQKLIDNAPTLKAIHLGCGFCVLFLGFLACQALVTTFHDKDGSAGLAILYIVFGVSSFVAPVIVEKMGIRLSLLISSLVYVAFIVCVEPYLDVIFLPISALEGVAAAVLWTAQPVYLSKCAPDPSVLGKFSGIFYAIFQSAIILGNLLSGALLSSNIKEESLLYILALISLCGSIVIALLRNPKASSTSKDERYLTSSQLDISGDFSKPHASPPTSPVLESKKTDSVPEKTPPLVLFTKTVKLCFTRKMLWLHPLFIHQGLSNAIFMGAFPLQMTADRIGFVIAVLGISNVIGSIMWGKIYDWKGWKALVIPALFLGPLSYFASTLHAIGLWPLFLAAAGFGFLDSCQNTLVFVIISSRYPEEQEKICAFAVSKVSNAFASGVSFFLIDYLNYITLVAIATGNIILVCACIAGLYLWQSFSSHRVFAIFSTSAAGTKHKQFHDEI